MRVVNGVETHGPLEALVACRIGRRPNRAAVLCLVRTANAQAVAYGSFVALTVVIALTDATRWSPPSAVLAVACAVAGLRFWIELVDYLLGRGAYGLARRGGTP